jgi:hypothetical protein
MSAPHIKHACPFCGETEHLDLNVTIERPIIRDGDTVKGPFGREVTEEVDGVHCQVCEAVAPLDVWNRERSPEVFSILRDFDEVLHLTDDGRKAG